MKKLFCLLLFAITASAAVNKPQTITLIWNDSHWSGSYEVWTGDLIKGWNYTPYYDPTKKNFFGPVVSMDVVTNFHLLVTVPTTNITILVDRDAAVFAVRRHSTDTNFIWPWAVAEQK